MGTRPQSELPASSARKSSRTSHTALTSNIEVNTNKSELLSAAHKWRLRKEKILFYFLLLLLSVSFVIGVAVMVYSADLYVKTGATAIISTIIRKATNYLLSQGSKVESKMKPIGRRGVAVWENRGGAAVTDQVSKNTKPCELSEFATLHVKFDEHCKISI